MQRRQLCCSSETLNLLRAHRNPVGVQFFHKFDEVVDRRRIDRADYFEIEHHAGLQAWVWLNRSGDAISVVLAVAKENWPIKASDEQPGYCTGPFIVDPAIEP